MPDVFLSMTSHVYFTTPFHYHIRCFVQLFSPVPPLLISCYFNVVWYPVKYLVQSCPQVTLLGLDLTRQNVDPTRPDPRLPTKRLTQPVPTPPPPICPQMYSIFHEFKVQVENREQYTIIQCCMISRETGEHVPRQVL